MEYLFVHDKNGGWWLKVTTAEQVLDYVTQSTLYGEGLDLYWELVKQGIEPLHLPLDKRIEFMTGERSRAFMSMQGAITEAVKYECSIVDGFKAMRLEFAENMMKEIRESGACYANSVGGMTFGVEADNFCRRSSLTFPQFNKDDIRVKRFDNGTHFYAYIGDIQVRQGEILKWNSFDEAYKMALSML